MDIKPPADVTQPSAITVNRDQPGTLQQLPKSGPLTAIVESSTPIAQQQAQQGRPTLFDTLLNVNGTRIPTHSNHAFTAGQILSIEITANAALRVLGVVSEETSSQRNQPRMEIQQGLRQALPIQQSSALLLNNLAPLFKLLGSTHNPAAATLIRELLNTIPDMKQLSNPIALKQSIIQSGIFFESSLKQLQGLLQQQLQSLLPTKTQVRQTSQPIQNTTGSAAEFGDKGIKRDDLLMMLRDNTQFNKQLAKLLGQDFKAQLLKLSSSLLPMAARLDASAPGNPAEASLLQRILQVLPDIGSNFPASPGKAGLSLSNLPISTQLHLLINPELPAGKTQASQQTGTAQANNTMDLAVSTVLRQIAATLARIQSNQLQSLAGLRTDGDSTNLINSWHIEIPAFLEGQFKPIQLQINEEHSSQQPEHKDSKNRLWKITLGFDFEDLGQFFATLRIVDNSVSATFWSEQPETLQRINSELQHLNKSLHKLGLNVEELQCRRGKPALQETRLDQQLVDIKT